MTVYDAAAYSQTRFSAYEASIDRYNKSEDVWIKSDARFKRDRELTALVWMVYSFVIGIGFLLIRYACDDKADALTFDVS